MVEVAEPETLVTAAALSVSFPDSISDSAVSAESLSLQHIQLPAQVQELLSLTTATS